MSNRETADFLAENINCLSIDRECLYKKVVNNCIILIE